MCYKSFLFVASAETTVTHLVIYLSYGRLAKIAQGPQREHSCTRECNSVAGLKSYIRAI